MAYDQITLVGNVGKEPEARYTPQGTLVTNFNLAVNRFKKDADNETLWFRCTAWERMAEVANEYLAKGRQVMVIGRLQADPETGGPKVYERNDGSHGASFEVTVDRLVLLGHKGDTSGEKAPEEDSESLIF